jgi:hypothetical protein
MWGRDLGSIGLRPRLDRVATRGHPGHDDPAWRSRPWSPRRPRSAHGVVTCASQVATCGSDGRDPRTPRSSRWRPTRPTRVIQCGDLDVRRRRFAPSATQPELAKDASVPRLLLLACGIAYGHKDAEEISQPALARVAEAHVLPAGPPLVHKGERSVRGRAPHVPNASRASARARSRAAYRGPHLRWFASREPVRVWPSRPGPAPSRRRACSR